MPASKEQREAAAAARAEAAGEDRAAPPIVSALEAERRGYVQRGLKDRVAQVDEQLRVARTQGSED